MKKVMLATIAGFALLVFLLTYFYRSVQEEHWRQELLDISLAFQQTDLVKVLKVNNFTGDQPYTIVYGEDSANQPVIVWVEQGAAHLRHMKDGVTEQTVRSEVLRRKPDSTLMRVVPGVVQDNYVWEVFYKTPTDNGERYYYDYYRFNDGLYLETYTLSER